AEHELIEPEMGIAFHDVPDDRFSTDGQHRLGEVFAGFADAGTAAATEDDDFHHADWIIPVKSEKPADCSAGFSYYPGDVLLSHAVAHAVSSAMRSLTAVFGMGTGVSSAL